MPLLLKKIYIGIYIEKQKKNDIKTEKSREWKHGENIDEAEAAATAIEEYFSWLTVVKVRTGARWAVSMTNC